MYIDGGTNKLFKIKSNQGKYFFLYFHRSQSILTFCADSKNDYCKNHKKNLRNYDSLLILEENDHLTEFHLTESVDRSTEKLQFRSTEFRSSDPLSYLIAFCLI